MTVTALLVSHDGARWLPSVLDGIAAQTRPVDALVAIDTGSKDDSVALVAAGFGASTVTEAPRGTAFPQAVELGLARIGEEVEWIWLLHDDANPASTALAELLAAAQVDPDADILGPKLREWPSLRRLLELGITISGTGRRETGLERGEYDQGQHDEVRRVLAVNTAGMLVRRRVLVELGGFDPLLPIFGNDLDFGWRAASAGHRTLIVPQAVVFHAEAAHRGTRRTPLTGRHTHYQERRAALYTLLANTSARSLPWQVVRLTLGTLLRVAGFLLVRSVGEALDELAALVSLYSRPGQLWAARRARRRITATDPTPVRSLLAPRWLPYRHGLDFVSDLAAAATQQAQDVAERRRAAKLEAEGVVLGAPVADEDDELAADSGLAARFLTNPMAVLVTVFVAVALVGTRAAWGHLSGGALSPAPAGVGDWWRLYTQDSHPLGNGSSIPAPAYLLPLALAGTILGGSASAAVSFLMVLAIPVALWGAWRFLRVAGHLVSAEGVSRWLLAWGAASYALVLATSGAWGEGRLGTVAASAALPWLAHAALGFADPEQDRRWRAAWRVGLLLAVTTAFAPGIWVFAVLLGLTMLGLGLQISPASTREWGTHGPPLLALVVVPLLLAPWVAPLLLEGKPGGLLLEAGRLPAAALGFRDLVLGHAAAASAPSLLGTAMVVLALAALIPATSRILVIICWIVALVAAGGAALMSYVRLDLATTPAWPGLGVFAVVLQAAWLTAVVLAAHASLGRLTGSLGRVARVGGAATLAALPLVGLGWFVTAAQDSFGSEAAADVPAYMVQSSQMGPAHGILIIDGTVESGLSYSIRRGDGTTIGEDEIQALTPEDTSFTADVRTLVSRPKPAVVNGLADQGIEYVVLRGPADGRVAATLDAAAGLAQASAEDRSTRAWHVEKELDPNALDRAGSWLRAALLALQALAVLVVAVLCGPTRKDRR